MIETPVPTSLTEQPSPHRLDYSAPAGRSGSLTRRVFRWVGIVAVAGVAVCMLVIGSYVGYRWFEVKAARSQGEREAQAELQNNQPTIYVYGMARYCENFDPITGLPLTTLADCGISNAISARTEAHNQWITDDIKLHGPHAGSRIYWAAEIMDLSGTVDAATQKIKLLPGIASNSSDTRFSIAWMPPAIVLTPTGGKPQPINIPWVQLQAIDLVWGPPSADIAILKVRNVRPTGMPSASGSATTEYGCLDLRSGRWLRISL